MAFQSSEIDHGAVLVNELPACDFCKQEMGNHPSMVGRPERLTRAAYDGRTSHGPWAYMCEEHYANYGVGLGLGKGQRLVVRGA